MIPKGYTIELERDGVHFRVISNMSGKIQCHGRTLEVAKRMAEAYERKDRANSRRLAQVLLAQVLKNSL
jgi:hypothetical protein